MNFPNVFEQCILCMWESLSNCSIRKKKMKIGVMTYMNIERNNKI